MTTGQYERLRAREIAEARYGFRWHLAVYIAVNAIFVGIWYFTTPFLGAWNFPWPLFPIVIWGICPLGVHYLYAYGRYPVKWVERETEKILLEEGRGV